jgi:membrane-associated protease RseP (regulator of RpoE activity)
MEQARPEPESFGFPPRPELSGFSAAERGQLLDASSPPPPLGDLSDYDLRTPTRLKRVSIVLFTVTCLTTFWAGTTSWTPYSLPNNWATISKLVHENWLQGVEYMLAVMAILLTHEMGHFLQALRYRVHATYPLFLPLPGMLTGTMGAVISMDGSRADRKQLFDIGLTGPWAGLIVAVPMIWFGIKYAEPGQALEFHLGTPWIFKLIAGWIRPELDQGIVFKNPLFMAGWVGMLITGLNMLPVSQLDGGHVIYGLFGRQSKWVARAFILSAIAFIVAREQYNWVVMLVLVLFLGVDHPPTANDNVPLGPVRYAIGLASLLIPVFCFTPVLVG